MSKTTKTRTYKTKAITPAQKKFAKVVAKTDNATEAVRQAYGADTYTELSARNKAHRLLTNANVQREIEYQKAAIQMMATKALNKLDTLMDSDDESVALNSSRFIYEQVHGKATQKSTSIGVVFTQSLDNTQV